MSLSGAQIRAPCATFTIGALAGAERQIEAEGGCGKIMGGANINSHHGVSYWRMIDDADV